MVKSIRDAGPLRTKVYFQARPLVEDGYGNMVPGGEWETQFNLPDGTWANLQPMVGSESVQASRLQGKQPYLVTVRASSDTRLVNSAWRIVVKNNPDRVLAITAPPIEPQPGWLEIIATEGEPS